MNQGQCDDSWTGSTSTTRISQTPCIRDQEFFWTMIKVLSFSFYSHTKPLSMMALRKNRSAILLKTPLIISILELLVYEIVMKVFQCRRLCSVSTPLLLVIHQCWGQTWPAKVTGFINGIYSWLELHITATIHGNPLLMELHDLSDIVPAWLVGVFRTSELSCFGLGE
jgi:hypothetical protein